MKSTTADKQNLLANLLKREGIELLPKIRPRESGSHAPLSIAQQRLWFLQQVEPESTAYNQPYSCLITGPLDVAVLRRTLTEIVRRHEILRSTIELVDDQPMQVIHPAQPVSVPVIALEAVSEMGRWPYVRQLLTEESRRQFNLERGPLFHATLLRVQEEEHVGLFTMHHIISDGWSINILLREFSILYAAFAAGKTSPLPELPIQYA